MHTRNHRYLHELHQNGPMRNMRTTVAALLLWGTAIYVCPAQEVMLPPRDSRAVSKAAKKNRSHGSENALSTDDRLAVLASALDSKIPRLAEHDCSHLVHAIYERAGFPYAYAPSDDLYDGIEGFQRVAEPGPGDLVVWHGHAGIVVRPSRHVFFSFLHAGPGIDDYASRYWTGRGHPRFYRYIKHSSCPGCTLARGRGE